jgi:chorismate synthase
MGNTWGRLTVSDSSRWLTSALCPDRAVAERMISAVEAIRNDGDSLGRVVTCAVRGGPPGWGEARRDAP